MAYKASFSRGLKSGLLNPYGIEVFVCVLISLLLILASTAKTKIFLDFKYYVISISKPGLILVGKPFQFLNGSLIYFSDLKGAHKLNSELISENKNLKDEINKNTFLRVENFKLKKLLNIDEADYSKKITARILIDSYAHENSRIFIDVGKENGLKVNDIVFNEFGIIGRIAELGKNSSKVLTIFDQDSVIPAFSLESKKSFLLEGDVDKLNLKHLENIFDLKHNEVVVTTDAAGYFKEGIKIGKVQKTLNKVFVQPFAKKSDSIYVNVLIYDFQNQLSW